MRLSFRLKKYLNFFQSKIWAAFLFTLSIIIFGTIGYKVIEGYDILESLYLTIISISTVGSREGQNLSDLGKVFTMILILMSMIILAYNVSVLSEGFVNQFMNKEFQLRKIKKKIFKMKGHAIVAGVGRSGIKAIQKLLSHNIPVIVIEKDPAKIEMLKKRNLTIVEGSSTHDDILEQCNIPQASHFVSALPNDSDNLFTVLSVRKMSPKIEIISRAIHHTSVDKLKFAGADHIIMPDFIGGEYMASLIVSPDIVEFIDKLHMTGGENESINFVRLNIDKEEYMGKRIKDLKIRNLTGCNIIGLKKNLDDYEINPSRDIELQKGMILIALGNEEQVRKFKQTFES